MAAATRAPRGRLRPSHRANDRWTRTYSEVARHDLSTNSTTTKLGCRTIPYFSLAALSCRAVSACRSCTIKVRRIDVVRYATLRAASYRTVRYLSDARSAGLYSRSMYSCVDCLSCACILNHNTVHSRTSHDNSVEARASRVSLSAACRFCIERIPVCGRRLRARGCCVRLAPAAAGRATSPTSAHMTRDS